MKDNKVTIFSYEALGKKLRYNRRHGDITMQQISKVLGISYQQYQKFENGSNRISIEQLLKLCEFYNVKIEEMLSLFDL